MGKAITLDSRQDYQSILKNIRQLGVLRVDSCYQKKWNNVRDLARAHCKAMARREVEFSQGNSFKEGG
jgi:hypothetical protein